MTAVAFSALATPSAAAFGGARLHVVVPRASLLLPTPPTRRSSDVSPVYSLQLAGATKFSSLRVRASSSEEASNSDELLEDLKAKWDALDNKSTVLLYGGGAIVALWLSSIVVGAVNSVPLLPKIMELVGLGYTGWFVYRYLLFKQSRKELANDMEDLKKKITGSSL